MTSENDTPTPPPPPGTPSTYEVGYKKPPKSGQFKKGQSGNRSGKRKGVKNFSTLLDEELNSKITGTDEKGKKISISKKAALAKKIINTALKGDAKMTALFLKELRRMDEKMSRSATEHDAGDTSSPGNDPQTVEEADRKYQELLNAAKSSS